MKKEHRQLYCVNGADYGHGSGPEAGLCKLEQARAVETASGVDRDNEERIETWRLTGRDCNLI
jgi:hypothetical protein